MQEIESNLTLKKDFLIKVAACAFLLSMYFGSLSNNIADLDLWHQMALIRESIHLGYIPLNDQFAYTPTVFPSVQHEWGAGVIAYFLATRFGASGILAVKYLLASIILAFFFLCIKRRSISKEIFIFLLPIGIGLILHSFATTRAQMYSFTFVACLLWFFELDRKGERRWLVVWIPLYLIWINLHGGFLVGVGLVGAYWLEKLLRKEPHTHLILLCVAMVGLIAVNPYGFEYYPYLWHAMTIPRPYIMEWSPMWKVSDLLLLSLFFMSLILFIYSVKRIGIREAHGIALVFTTALAAFLCVRLIFFYAIVWAIYVPGYLQRTRLGNLMEGLCKKLSKFLIPILCIAAVAFFARGLSYQPWKLLVPSDHIKKYGNHPIYPIGPVEYLSGVSFKGNLMVFFDWGSYVIWKLYPDVRVSMDSRYEAAYPGWLVDENIKFYWAKDGWQRTLTAYPTDLVLVHKRLPLAKVMPKQSEWKKVYTDDGFELYARPGLLLPVVDWTGRVFMGTFP